MITGSSDHWQLRSLAAQITGSPESGADAGLTTSGRPIRLVVLFELVSMNQLPDDSIKENAC